MTTRILAYGDSNVWGDSGEGYRYATDEQWTNILQNILGATYEIVQNGVCGRTAGDIDEEKPHRNGFAYFTMAIHSVRPLDYTIISLGANDLKERYVRTAEQIATDLLRYAKALKDLSAREELKIKKEIVFLGEALETATGLTERDKTTLQQVYEMVRQAGCAVIIPDDAQRARDGLHYSVEGHRTAAEAMARAVRGWL